MAFHFQIERLSCQEVMNRSNSYASALHEVSSNRCKRYWICTSSYIIFIKISKTRQKILKCLENKYMLPSEIALKTDLGTTQVSNALSDLKNKRLVECINEADKKGIIYEITKLGLEVLNQIKKL